MLLICFFQSCNTCITRNNLRQLSVTTFKDTTHDQRSVLMYKYIPSYHVKYNLLQGFYHKMLNCKIFSLFILISSLIFAKIIIYVLNKQMNWFCSYMYIYFEDNPTCNRF